MVKIINFNNIYGLIQSTYLVFLKENLIKYIFFIKMSFRLELKNVN